MTKNTQTRAGVQDNNPWLFLSLLSALCTTYQQTFSWYTSGKHRVWLTLKGREPVTFTTSVELDPRSPIEQTLDAFVVLVSVHIRKVKQETPPLVTWLNSKAVGEQLSEAWTYVLSLDLETLGRDDAELLEPLA